MHYSSISILIALAARACAAPGQPGPGFGQQGQPGPGGFGPPGQPGQGFPPQGFPTQGQPGPGFPQQGQPPRASGAPGQPGPGFSPPPGASGPPGGGFGYPGGYSGQPGGGFGGPRTSGAQGPPPKASTTPAQPPKEPTSAAPPPPKSPTTAAPPPPKASSSAPATPPKGSDPSETPGSTNGAAGKPGACPQVWTDVAKDLKNTMVGSDGNCNDAARAAIRLVFHDCFPGACDGSIILSDECTSRPENAQLTGICKTLGDKAKQFKVSTADIIQLGGAVGIAACPGGPRISFKAGRTDSNQANPPNQLPSPNSTAAVLLQAFSSKGYSATELVALVGAHTAAKRIDGAALDTSVSTWDTKFYAETANGTAPATLPSDDNLSKASETKQMWNNFAKDSRGWTGAFVPAMTKLGLMGNDEKSLVDCSDVIAKSFA